MADPEYRPDQPSLLGSRLKVERAEEHLNELEPVLRAYVNSDPYRWPADAETEGDWMVCRVTSIVEYPDPRWGVRIGEFLHDLRSALDNLVWQLVLLNDAEPGDHNQFPIYTEPPAPARHPLLRKVPGKTRIDDMLLGVAPDQATVIKELQPYLGFHLHGQHKTALGILTVLSNADKHRFLFPSFGVMEKGSPGKAELVSGPAPSKVEVRYTTGPIYPGAEIFRWRVLGGTKETEVTVEGNIPHDIAFGHPKTTLSALDWLRERTSQIIERFASVFPPDPDRP
jgi:hypothetical protein